VGRILSNRRIIHVAALREDYDVLGCSIYRKDNSRLFEETEHEFPIEFSVRAEILGFVIFVYEHLRESRRTIDWDVSMRLAIFEGNLVVAKYIQDCGGGFDAYRGRSKFLENDA
jgi:hypothetical protein